jgi:glycerol-3-phosphate dehydrogenase (NAD(P)+)
MVVEGMFTTEAAYELAQKAGVEMPITEIIYHVINGKIEARDAVNRLMSRGRKHESE